MQGHDAQLPKMLTLESVTFEPTKEHPHNARSVFSFTVPKELCNMGGASYDGLLDSYHTASCLLTG